MIDKNIPLLSIIIPTFNSASTIRETLESIVKQTYKNVEILVLDNISNDATCNIVDEYIIKYPYIKLHSEKDKGVYDAMNKGINVSKGDFLYFMGGDDVFYNNETLDLIFTTDNLNYDFIYGNVLFKHSKKVHSGESNLTKLVDTQMGICHQAIFYKKRVFEMVGNYNLKYFVHADYDFNIRCFQNTEIKIKYVDIIVAIFNESGISGTHSNKDNFHTDLTYIHVTKNYNIVDLYNENKNLRKDLKNIKRSKEFRIGLKLMKPLRKIKRLFKKR